MKLGFIGAGLVARFHAIAIHQVRGLEIAGLLRRRGAEALASYLSAEKGKTIDLTDKTTSAELIAYVPLIQQGKSGAQRMR